MALLQNYISQLSSIEPKRARGQVDAVRGLTVRVSDLAVPMDSSVEIDTDRDHRIPGQVVGFENHQAIVMALGPLHGIAGGISYTPRAIPSGSFAVRC